ncbi:MAG: FapA family protein [Bacillota bacterium]
MKEEITRGFPAATASTADNAFPDGEAGGPYAFVKQGRLVVRHRPEGPYPVVVPCPGVRLIINGRECTQPTPVSMKDTVQVETAKEERREGNWSVSVSSDGLQAILRTRPTVVVHRELPDLPPARILQLKVVEREERLPPLTWDELLQELSRLGINYGVDWEACSRGVASCAEEEVVIARGIPAEPGKDGRVELLFSSDSKVPVLAGEDETVDFRERYVFTSVEAGDILAVKHPPGPGRPGTSVKGEVIVPPSPRDFTLSVGEGAVLTRDGERAVAARAGRPVASRWRNLVKVSVLPELVHDGDVDLNSGNIVFKGDVLIAGNVAEGMAVEAGGNVRVGGLVSGARVQATGSVLIRRNILSSVVIAGGVPAFLQGMLPQVHALAAGLQEMSTAIRQLLGNPAFKQGDLKGGIGPLVKLLLEGKFRHLPAAANTFKKQVKTMPPGMAAEDLGEFIQEVERALVRSPLAVRDLRELETLARRAGEWEKVFASPPSAESDVVASSVHSSTVIATGDVRVVGSGCYNSRIQAGKKVTVSGVFRGGEIQAGGDVHVGELGSRGGATTRVVTGPAAVVTVGYAFENASIVVGGWAYRFNREEKGIRLWLDKEGNLRSKGIPA